MNDWIGNRAQLLVEILEKFGVIVEHFVEWAFAPLQAVSTVEMVPRVIWVPCAFDVHGATWLDAGFRVAAGRRAAEFSYKLAE
ncbi:hypothetical protein [Pseudarthrobacter sp. MDT3-1]